MSSTHSNIYVFFLSVLPVFTGVDKYTSLPFTSEDLAKCLEMLSEEDREQIAKARWLIRLRHGDEEEQVLLGKMRRTLDEIDDRVLREVLLEILEKRTAMALLRRRSAGKDCPGPQEDFGFGDAAIQGRFNWSQPYLGLEYREPWIVRARRLFDLREAKELEKLMLRNSWNIITRARSGQIYSRTDVFLYVLQWELIRRFCAHDASVAASRVQALVEETVMAGAGKLFEGGAT
ncbi:MAG: hypothetical protein EOM26_05795 [Alphaproteobacteria bacterium]|nr:hypothetical protein [Alphaproteobacteria bacterium]